MSSDGNKKQPKIMQHIATNFLNEQRYIKVVEVSAMRIFTKISAVFDR